MPKTNNKDLFRRLTRLFRSGPLVKKKIRTLDTAMAVPDKTKSSGVLLFQKSTSPTYATITGNAYNLSERLMRYQDFCFGRDTLVYTLDGVFTIEELSKKHPNGQRFFVYSYDYAQKKPVIGTAFFPRVANGGVPTRRVRVMLDDGGHVDLTPDHKVILRDGTTLEAEKLKPGDSLMPLYVSDINGYGYNWVYMLGAKTSIPSGWLQEHVLVAEQLLRRPEPGDDVHHKDFNKQNNHPSNLQVMSESEHMRLHAQLNNVNKLGKQNLSHSRRMKEHAKKRHDVTFKSIVDACLTHSLTQLNDVADVLDADFNVIKLRLKERGFKNWVDFQARFSEAQAEATHEAIVFESRTPSYEEIAEASKDASSLDELASRLSCTRSSINRRLQSHGVMGGWTELKTGNVYAGKKRGPAYSGPSYQEICSAYRTGMTQVELAEAVDSTKNKVGTCLKHAGFVSYTKWTETFQNHKVVSVDEINDDVVYTITVEKHHNLAVGSFSVKQPKKRKYSLIFCTQCEMEYTPELARGMDIYADESVASDEKGRILHVFSSNPKTKELLEDLFYNTLNVEFNLRSWTRSLVKYGDFFLYNDISPEYGVVNAFPIPVNEVEREENYDREDPFAVRFRWVSLANRILENWEVTHFRLLGNDMFLPYGSSIIEPARRIWRQLILIEDAMLVYRVVRAPERRVFYIDVGNTPAEDVPNYVEEQKKQLRSQQVVDRTTGRVDLRYNPLCFQQDTYVPLLDGRTITIKQLNDEWSAGKRDHEVYSLDLENNGRVVPGKVIWVGSSGRATKMATITLDDGCKIKVTPDHKMMLRDGNPVKACDLRAGDSLMPLHSRFKTMSNETTTADTSNAYEQVLDPASGVYYYTHRLIAAAKDDLRVYDNGFIEQQGYVIHHKNHNKRDNSTSNLEMMTREAHSALHAALGRKNIIAYNKSERKRKQTADNNRLYKKAQAMGQAYNGSELHKQHNKRRRQAQQLSWKKNKDVRSAAMRFTWDDECQRRVIELVRTLEKFEGIDAFLRRLVTVDDFVAYYAGINQHLKRDPKKSFHKAVVGKFITEQYADWKSVWAANHPAALGRHFVNNVDASVRSVDGPNNHCVTNVEIIDADEDVYNVTVDKYHNLAVQGVDVNGCTLPNLGKVQCFQSVDEDYFIAVRGGESGTRIETLKGGENAAAVEDVQYIQKKLFAALGIPRAYLGYDELLSCLISTTCVDLLDGRTLNLEQIKDELDAGREVWVYSVDQETHRIVPGRVLWAGPTRKNAELVRVTLDNGCSFDCTPDHKWMLRDGTWCEASLLTPGQPLMPKHVRRASLHGGCDYEQVFDPASGKWTWTHQLVHDRFVNSEVHPSAADECRTVIHHKDGNRFNNSPTNLVKMGFEAHRKHHADNLAVVRARALSDGKYSGLANGWAARCRSNVEHLWSMQKLVGWCLSNRPLSKREMISGYGLSETQLTRLLAENNVTYAEFAERYVEGGYKLSRSGHGGHTYPRYVRVNGKGRGARGAKFEVRACASCSAPMECNVKIPKKFCSRVCRYAKGGKFAKLGAVLQSGLLNHRVVSVVPLAERCDTWCMEVAGTHNFALANSVIISNSKATLAQEDIRFSRSISVIQKTITAELNKLAIIHLYAHGYDGEELQDFVLRLSNPSTVAQQQKLELIRARAEIAGSFPDGIVDKQWIRKEVLNFADDHIDEIDSRRMRERALDAKIDAIAEASAEGGGGGGGGGGSDLFGGGGGEGEPSGGDEGEEFGSSAVDGGEEAGGVEEPPGGEEITAADEPEELDEPDVSLLTSSDDPGDDISMLSLSEKEKASPVKVGSTLDRHLYNRSRRRTHGPSKTHLPDFVKMTGNDSHSMHDPYDNDWIRATVSNPLGESRALTSPLAGDVRSMLSRMAKSWGDASERHAKRTLVEDVDVWDGVASDQRIDEDTELFIDDEMHGVDDATESK